MVISILFCLFLLSFSSYWFLFLLKILEYFLSYKSWIFSLVPSLCSAYLCFAVCMWCCEEILNSYLVWITNLVFYASWVWRAWRSFFYSMIIKTIICLLFLMLCVFTFTYLSKIRLSVGNEEEPSFSPNGFSVVLAPFIK